jgi:hypothetical protein
MLDALMQWTNNKDGVVKALQQLEMLGMLHLDKRFDIKYSKFILQLNMF